ncbi:hypothetical protein GH733_004722 [Mirounga leonina]|nr:hypothetical protein GH733_004722 [Mirounga leonina]
MEGEKNLNFYVFSYHHDFAAKFGLTDAEKGGSLVVVDFETLVKCVEFMFLGNKMLKLTQKIDNVKTSYALGAIFHYIDSLNRQKSQASW